MPWLERFLPASFRGIPFGVESHTAAGGRRIEQHEYPNRDKPFAEDLGRRSRGFAVEGWIVGDGYFVQRDLLISACERPGPGLLTHPYLGVHRVACDRYEVSERVDEGRMCRITMTFAESGQSAFPAAILDLSGALADAASTAIDSVVERFGEAFEL